MTFFTDAIHYICSHSKVDANLVAVLYKIIEKAPEKERVELFVRFLYECKYTSEDMSAAFCEGIYGDITEDELYNAKKKVSMFVFGRKTRGLSESDFYAELYEFIISEAQSTPKKFIVFTLACVQNPGIPYVDESSALTMSQEEFEETQSEMDRFYINVIKHLSQQDFSQVTQLASKYIEVLDLAEDYKEKSILLTLMLMEFRNKFVRLPLEDFGEDD